MADQTVQLPNLPGYRVHPVRMLLLQQLMVPLVPSTKSHLLYVFRLSDGSMYYCRFPTLTGRFTGSRASPISGGCWPGPLAAVDSVNMLLEAMQARRDVYIHC
jgi:hypothetical protein